MLGGLLLKNDGGLSGSIFRMNYSCSNLCEHRCSSFDERYRALPQSFYSAPLFIMGPHSNHFNYFFVINNLIN